MQTTDYFSTLSRPVGNNNNNNNNNNNGVGNRSSSNSSSSSTNNQPQSPTYSTLGSQFGLHKLPSNIKVIEVEADMGQVRSVDSSCQIQVTNIIEFISYQVATDKKDVDIHIYVGESNTGDDDDTIYNIACTFNSTSVFNITEITRTVVSYDPLRTYEDIKIHHDNETLKHCILIPFHKKPMIASQMTRTHIHYTAKPPIYTFDTGKDDNKRASVKRKFNDT
jgi:hypothetical protein